MPQPQRMEPLKVVPSSPRGAKRVPPIAGAPGAAGFSWGPVVATLLRAKTCLDPPFCLTCQVSPRIMMPPRDGRHHQQQSCGGRHAQDIGKHGGMSTGHCGDSPGGLASCPWFQEEARSAAEHRGCSGSRQKVQGPEHWAQGPREYCCSLSTPSSLVGAALSRGCRVRAEGGEGLDHGAGGGACPRLSL